MLVAESSEALVGLVGPEHALVDDVSDDFHVARLVVLLL